MEKWYDVLAELAQLLNKFYLKEKQSAGVKLYSLCVNSKNFKFYHTWISKFIRSGDIASLDPIHVFTSINEERTDLDYKIARVNEWFVILNGNKKFTKIDFIGCPSPETRLLILPRNFTIQMEIWEVFSKLVEVGQSVLSKDLFDKVKRWRGVEIHLFTVFLFWVDSNNFLPLSRDMVKLLITTEILKGQPKYTIEEYKKLLPAENTALYREITSLSLKYRYHNRGLKEDKKKIIAFFKMSESKRPQGPDFVDFRIVAIRLLEGTPAHYSKVLSLNRYYVFYPNHFYPQLQKYLHPGSRWNIYELPFQA